MDFHEGNRIARSGRHGGRRRDPAVSKASSASPPGCLHGGLPEGRPRRYRHRRAWRGKAKVRIAGASAPTRGVVKPVATQVYRETGRRIESPPLFWARAAEMRRDM